MSRTSVVAMLAAAEVLIVGMAIYAVGGGGTSFAAATHPTNFTAAAIAPVAAGAAPHVVIDDASSRVNVVASNDGLVHVRDLTEMHGTLFGDERYPRLSVTRTPDGVRIERPVVEGFSLQVFGFVTHGVEVQVPPDSHVEISRCAGADVAGLAQDVSVHSIDGHVTLADLQGSADVRSDDGYISATNVRGDRLTMESRDGHLALDDVAVGSLSGSTRDGRIEADGLSIRSDSTLQTDDGSVRVGFARNSDLTIDASTRDGRITVDGNSLDRGDSWQRTIRLGAGTSHMQISTADGPIRIFTNGAYQQ